VLNVKKNSEMYTLIFSMDNIKIYKYIRGGTY